MVPRGPQAAVAEDPGGFVHIVLLDRVDSTSAEAARRAAAGAPAGTFVVAGEQIAGRGRRGRTWQSPPGNFYGSLLLRPGCRPADAAQLGFVAGVALAETLEDVLPSPAGVQCKWPNDLLVAGRKAAGILLDAATTGAGRLDWVIVGLGVNLRWCPPDRDGQFPATTVRAETGGGDLDPPGFLARLAPTLVAWLRRWEREGFSPIRTAWLERAYCLDEAVRVVLGDNETLNGSFTGINGSGAMILACDGGIRVISAGDVVSARPLV
ncbi:MAG: biotin--[acetyl-CoA-carboxylase] ligase [Rhodospirillales bacterium]|nr:MAG: biotin--[acetyl-CoA-carboxylase] ligase [Rhodospirillales bacterium]